MPTPDLMSHAAAPAAEVLADKPFRLKGRAALKQTSAIAGETR